MRVEILSTGPMLTIQDKGRYGLRHLGVPAAGAIDMPAMMLANVLCGNDPDAAVLEFAGPAGAFRVNQPVRFAVVGGHCNIRVDDRQLQAGESHYLLPDEILTIGAPKGVVWAYIAFSGGIETPPVLGARATHLRNGLGGIEGRCLRVGDQLMLGPETRTPCLRSKLPLVNAHPFGSDKGPVRIIPGPQQDYFSTAVFDRLTSASFTVTAQRDRMAMVLGGVELSADRGYDIVSDGTVPGSIQVPGSGQPLVLLAESQTTGGYPKIATVASADLPRLAQLPVGSQVHFSLISRDEGEELWLAQHAELSETLNGLVEKSQTTFDSAYLLSCDLVGGITAPAEIAGLD